jgi:hypothetical protein
MNIYQITPTVSKPLANLSAIKKLVSPIKKAGYSLRDKSLSVNFYDAVKKSTFLGIKKSSQTSGTYKL